MNKLCQCGCGEEVTQPWNNWLVGHHARARKEGDDWVPRFNHETIKTMLTNGVSHMEISRHVGCSRERIRQLDLKYFGITGRERQDKRRTEREAVVVLPNHPFVQAAIDMGFTVQSYKRSARLVLVNGKLCYLRRAPSHNCGTAGKNYFVLHHSGVAADFYIYACGSEYLIIPNYAAPVAETSIALRPMPKRGARSFRHDYQQYLNAWNLLGRPYENSKAS